MIIEALIAKALMGAGTIDADYRWCNHRQHRRASVSSSWLYTAMLIGSEILSKTLQTSQDQAELDPLF